MGNYEGKTGCSKLAKFSFGLAAGIVCGLWSLFLGLAAANYNVGTEMVHMIGSVYKGFVPTTMGAVYGGLWGFVEGFIGGFIFAAIYNACVWCKLCLAMGGCKKD